jgi:hypothetical protein
VLDETFVMSPVHVVYWLLEAVVVPTQLIPAQPLWSKFAAVVASIPMHIVPLVPLVDKPAVSVTPVMSPVHVV